MHAISSFYGSLCEKNTLVKKMYIKKSDGPRIEPSGTRIYFISTKRVIIVFCPRNNSSSSPKRIHEFRYKHVYSALHFGAFEEGKFGFDILMNQRAVLKYIHCNRKKIIIMHYIMTTLMYFI